MSVLRRIFYFLSEMMRRVNEEDAISNTRQRTSADVLREVYLAARVIRSGSHLTTINELCDQVPALRPGTLKAAVEEALKFGTFEANKILSEEDKGAPIASAVSLAANLPLCMARWYPYKLPDQIEVDIKSEYFSGSLFVNGIERGDKILIIDDTLSTGGTMVALIEAVRKAGATIVGAIAIVEKVKNEGHAFVQKRTGIDVKTCMKIIATESGVEVVG